MRAPTKAALYAEIERLRAEKGPDQGETVVHIVMGACFVAGLFLFVLKVLV